MDDSITIMMITMGIIKVHMAAAWALDSAFNQQLWWGINVLQWELGGGGMAMQLSMYVYTLKTIQVTLDSSFFLVWKSRPSRG